MRNINMKVRTKNDLGRSLNADVLFNQLIIAVNVVDYKLLIAVLLFSFSIVAYAQQPQRAINDVELIQVNEEQDFVCSLTAYYALNKNVDQRVFVTIKMSWTPVILPGTWYEGVKRSKYTDLSPLYFGLLLMPGERRRIGCEDLPRVFGKSLKFTYTKEGAYYPIADVSFPDLEKPEQYLKYFLIPGSGSQCEVSGNKGAQPVAFNFHPSRSIYVEFETNVPKPKTIKFNLGPWGYSPQFELPCTAHPYLDVSIKRIEFMDTAIRR